MAAVLFLSVTALLVTWTSASLPAGCCRSNMPDPGIPGTPCISDYPCGFSQSGNTVYISPGICCTTSSLNPYTDADEFQKCVNSYHFPGTDLSQIFANMAALLPGFPDGITSEAEMMMAIAQMSSESKGFSSVREEACIKSQPPPERCRYPGNPKLNCTGGTPNEFYYGRGYIQITGCPNYQAASLAIFNDDRLVKNPDVVASDPLVAMQTALWFWKTNVHKRQGVTDGDFGATTKAIHGKGACTNPKWIPNSKLRYQQFIKCLQASGKYDKLQGKVNESGCYPVAGIFNFINMGLPRLNGYSDSNFIYRI